MAESTASPLVQALEELLDQIDRSNPVEMPEPPFGQGDFEGDPGFELKPENIEAWTRFYGRPPTAEDFEAFNTPPNIDEHGFQLLGGGGEPTSQVEAVIDLLLSGLDNALGGDPSGRNINFLGNEVMFDPSELVDGDPQGDLVATQESDPMQVMAAAIESILMNPDVLAGGAVAKRLAVPAAENIAFKKLMDLKGSPLDEIMEKQSVFDPEELIRASKEMKDSKAVKALEKMLEEQEGAVQEFMNRLLSKILPVFGDQGNDS